LCGGATAIDSGIIGEYSKHHRKDLTAMDTDAQDERIAVILGGKAGLDFDEAVKLFAEHLKCNLSLPCEVTGIEDFRWEEFYVMGPGDREEYVDLKKTQPSYTDRYELLGIECEAESPWMLFFGEDIGASVRRISDGKKFVLGLSELEATDKRSENYQLLDDYSVWLVNSR